MLGDDCGRVGHSPSLRDDTCQRQLRTSAGAGAALSVSVMMEMRVHGRGEDDQGRRGRGIASTPAPLWVLPELGRYTGGKGAARVREQIFSPASCFSLVFGP